MARNKKESPMLKKHFDATIPPAIQERFETLAWLWIDPELLAQFRGRIEEIVEKDPASEEVIIWELGKTQIGVEALFTNYSRQFRSILDHAANDDFYREDSNVA